MNLNHYLTNYRYRFFNRIKYPNPLVLEVGIGNNSPKVFKHLFPYSIYHGIDKDLFYNLDEQSISIIDKFFKIDLEKNDLSQINNNYYNYIIIAHVIEHTENGYEIISSLFDKLKKGGMIYIEYPREKSKTFPSMKGTLNFYDDPTHKKSYDIVTLNKILLKKGGKIIKSGIKRDLLRILGIPYMMIKSKFTLGYVRGSIFWDILGFSNYILAKKI